MRKEGAKRENVFGNIKKKKAGEAGGEKCTKDNTVPAIPGKEISPKENKGKKAKERKKRSSNGGEGRDPA